MAVDNDEFVFVATAGEKHVSLFDSALMFVCNIVKHKLHSPQRVCFDGVKRRLYVAQSEGNAVVVQV